MKKLVGLVLLFGLVMVAGLAQSSTALADTAEAPQLLAVKFHADWCGSCKKMGTAFDDLRNKLDGRSVLFVQLDRTNGSTSHQAGLLAAALGLGKVYAENAGTGFILLLDSQTREVVGKLTADQGLKDMAAEIEQRLGHS